MAAILDRLKTMGAVSPQTGIPILVLAVLLMMLLPLPPLVLDLFFTLNIGVSVLVLVAALNIKSFKDFIAFPTILLLTTLLRLSLNVASTRVILLDGHTGTDAAGKIIEAFGAFLIGGSFAVGIVIFIVITIINFVVITKGSTRVAEVSARFILDALPGKQMAIDADLNAGIINQEEARIRRATVAQEADFYGSMDGASKFVRGDAVAGILILIINIVGGVTVGVVAHDLSFNQSLVTYGGLTIGDGLVAQIPALIISTAAGILVTRVSTDEVFADQLSTQLVANRNSLAVVAGILAVLAIIPGIPPLTFLLFAALFGGLAYVVHSKTKKQEQLAAAASGADIADELSWTDVPVIEAVRLELGYRLIPIVDKGEKSDLIKRIRAIRRKFINEMGFLSPSVHIRDNLKLQPETYRFLIYGGEVGRGQCLPDKLLAISPDGAAPLSGVRVSDPSFGMPATWIDTNLRDLAIQSGSTVIEPAVVISTHLETLMNRHAGELLGRQETQDLLDNFKKSFPKLVEDVVPKVVPVVLLERILQLLLEEGVPIKDLRTILEVASEHAPKQSDPLELLPMVRVSLRRTIFMKIFEGAADIRVIGLQPEFESLIEQAQGTGPVAPDGMIEPSLMALLVQETAKYVDLVESTNYPSVIVTTPRIRLTIARLVKRIRPQTHVLSVAELPSGIELKFEHIMCAQASGSSGT
jgi:flagellar biosynthesis protein FlhA